MLQHHPAYRAEIDGLRAIAVLAVVFYHFSVPGIAGGFVGVDIFFVISGFLIGGLLWQEMNARGTISLANFYSRRVRRLAPAYFAMALATTIAAYFILLPFEFRAFGKTLIASTVYLSNVQFFREAGYFDIAGAEKPLLHTWSLSVEEQFYIVLPPLMLLLARWKGVLLSLIAAIVVASLIACIVVTRTSYTATFFLFPFRAWELGAGVLLAIYGARRRETWRHGAVWSWTGLLMLVWAILFTEPGETFPGYHAVLPVLGSLMIIFNGQDDNPVNRLLSSRGPVAIGLISYSLYLWHWPVVTLATYYAPLSGRELAGLMAFVFLLAWASWRFIEQPVRLARFLRPSVLISGLAVSSAVLIAAGGMAYVRDGMPGRFGPDVRMHIDASADFIQDWSRCRIDGDGPFKGVETCAIGPEGPPNFIVWGDSHVRAFKEGLDRLAHERGKPGMLIWRAGCPPLFDVAKHESAATPEQDQECTDANRRLRTALPGVASAEKLLLIGRWAYYSEGQGVGRDAINKIALSAEPSAAFAAADQHSLFAEAVLKTMPELARKFGQIVVLRQVPEIPNYDSRFVARELAHGRLTAEAADGEMIHVSMPAAMERARNSEAPFRKLAAEGTIQWLDPWNKFCSQTECSAVNDGRAYYFDNNHVTNTTAMNLREIFSPIMEDHKDVQMGELRQ